MGEELELGNLFVICDDGTRVPFEGIKPVDIQNCDNDDVVVYAHWPSVDEPITLEFDMKRRDHRKAMKMFKAQVNGYRRRKRYAIRQKERARRRALKGAKYV